MITEKLELHSSPLWQVEDRVDGGDDDDCRHVERTSIPVHAMLTAQLLVTTGSASCQLCYDVSIKMVHDSETEL